MLEDIIAIDLETTGLDAASDGIIEFGAVRIRDGEAVARFSKLCNPGVRIPPEVERLTGITNAEIARSAPADEVLDEFMAFLDDLPLVAHNSGFDMRFLKEKTGGGFANEMYDTLELARILMPALPRHNLTTVVKHLELPELSSHRAPDDAEMTARVWLALQKMIEQLPPPVLQEINWLLAGSRSTTGRVFADAGRRRLLEGFSARSGAPGLADVFQNFAHLHVRRAAATQAELPVKERLDTDEVPRMFSAGGLFSERMPGHEHRDEQIRMVESVCQAFNTGRHLMVEAGTGTGKSMAYLVPAILWSVLNKRKVIVSTNTKNLQEQLFNKDLPFLEDALPFRFKRALLKGRANYLCIRKLLYTLTNKDAELNAEERRAMLPVVVWAAQTETGDIAENTAYFAASAAAAVNLADRIHTVGDECLGKTCRYYRKCFLWKARMEALAADIVVANHAVVFSDIASDNKILPPYLDIIFDEAHNIENVATEHLGATVNRMRIIRVLARLYRRAGRKKSGHLTAIARFSDDRELCEIADRAMDQCSAIVKTSDEFFDCVKSLLSRRRSGSDNALAFTADERNGIEWGPVESSGGQMVRSIRDLAQSLDRLTESMRDLGQFRREAGRELMVDIAAQAQFLRETIGDIEFIVRADEENFVFWTELSAPLGRRREQYASLRCAPVRIAPALNEQLYKRKECIIFSSATLTVGGSFEFFRSRLGLDLVAKERVFFADVGSPFDFEKQALVCVANFLPEPTRGEGHEYARELSAFLGELFAATGGRALALFTSYKLLDAVYQDLKPVLDSAGILLLCQGRTGSRASITRAFQSDVRSVLLGTASFWEGVDVAGEALSCLVLTRLPFQVFTDPVFQARYEDVERKGGNAFMNFSVPNAAIRFRQGFGRLIRSRRDRGVVIVADKRIVTKRYGSQFSKSLPVTHIKNCARKDVLIDEVRRFLAHP